LRFVLILLFIANLHSKPSFKMAEIVNKGFFVYTDEVLRYYEVDSIKFKVYKTNFYGIEFNFYLKLSR